MARKSALRFTVVESGTHDSDVARIKVVSQQIRNELQSGNMAARWITAGQKLKELKEILAEAPKGSNDRVPWTKAHEVLDGSGRPYLPFSRSTADKLIAVHQFFERVPNRHTSLPVSWKALYLLVTKFKDLDRVEKLTSDGEITAFSTEAELRTLGVKLGVITAPKTRAATQHSKPTQCDLPLEKKREAVFAYMAQLGLTLEDLS